MANYDELTQALGGEAYYLADDPLYSYGTQMMKQPAMPIQAGEGFWSNFWPGALQSGLGGLARGWGESQAQERMAEDYSALNAALQQPTFDEQVASFGDDEGLIARVSPYLLGRQQEQKDRLTKLQDALAGAQATSAIQNPYLESPNINFKLDPATGQIGVERAPTTADIAAQAATGNNPVATNISPVGQDTAEFFPEQAQFQVPPEAAGDYQSRLQSLLKKYPMDQALRMMSHEQQAKKNEGIDERYAQTKQRREQETSFPGYVFTAASVRPTPSEAAKVRQELENNAELKYTLGSLGENIDKEGFMNLFGNNAQFQGAMRSFIFNTFRKATGSGARLEGPEGAMLQVMTPAVLSGNFAGAIKSLLTNRDPAQLAKDMITMIEETEKKGMAARFGAVRGGPLDLGQNSFEQPTPQAASAMVTVTNPKTGRTFQVPANDPRLKMLGQ